MEVILLEKVRKLGSLGQTVNVKSGFARNFLVPKGKAVYATVANVAKFEQRRAELEKSANDKHEQALQRQQALNALPTITLIAKAGEEGKLFGSITVRDIVLAVEKAGSSVEKREISLPAGGIRMLGNHEIPVELESDITAIIKLNVVSGKE